MEEKKQDRFLDDLLDAGLARYSNVTPRPGLEGRILANARAARQQSSWFVWAGRLAAGAVAAIIVVGVFNLAHRRAKLIQPPAATTGETAPQISVSILPGESDRESRPSRRALMGRMPRSVTQTARQETLLDVFPSPQPLTEQEKLLAQYVRQTPAEVLAASPTESTLIPELEIKPLDIAPLDTEETKTN
jgi:hypothetical protein